MSNHRQGGRRADRRAFRPGDQGRLDLEPRLLLSAAQVSTEAVHTSRNIQYRTAFGGAVALIKDTDGELFNVNVTGGGAVRAKPMKGGRVMLIVDGTTSDSILSINPALRNRLKGSAHEYPAGKAKGDRLLHIGAIKVSSGVLGQILGYQTADLSGPINLPSVAAVDRIAFFQYLPGASITTGGDLNTLDAFTNLTIGGGPGISVGRDLNFLSVGGNLNINDGSTFSIARDLGLNPQPAKGSDPGGQGAIIQGNMAVAPTGLFAIGRALQAPFIVNGTVSGAGQIDIPFGASNFVARGGLSA